MRLALAALLLGLACAPLSAQTEREPKKAKQDRPQDQRAKERVKGDPPPKHGGHTAGDSQAPKKTQRDHEQERRRATHQERPRQEREKPKHDPTRPQDQRAKERVPGDPPPKHGGHTVSRDSEPPKGKPSPAQQQQRQIEQQRREQQGKQQTADSRVIQCSARPVCRGGGYGRCMGVQETYRGGTEESRRQAIVNDCIQANTPDSCNCAVECRRVAQCSIF